MEPSKGPPAKLLYLSPIEVKDEADEKNERCYSHVQNLIANTSESEAHDALNNQVCKSPVAHEEVCLGLLVSILCEAGNAQRYYRDLTYVTRDGLAFLISSLNQIIVDKFTKLSDACRKQVIWLLRELIKNSISGADTLVFNILRQISGGDISPKNIWLTENVLDLLADNRLWLEKNPVLLATVVYTYLRLIIDHGGNPLQKLRQKEVEFCALLLRERFADCIPIGRDLVRLLQNVSRIPEFEQIWKTLIQNPGSLCEGFTGILQLMQKRTSRRFLQCRLTPDMEKKMVFLTSMVKLGQQARYQQWFQRQYLSTPESQSLRCDLVRFICGVIHPSNDVLCSDIIPRWAVIGWMLSTCTSNVAASNAKLSLFYDWLFYDKDRDNIMNIEPAILVMFHSMRNHPVITSTLLDFLCRIMNNFYQPLTTQIKQGITTCFYQILEKRVLPSLIPLFECPRLDAELKALVWKSFPEFCSSNGVQRTLSAVSDGGDIKEETGIVSSQNSENEARFSDDETDTIVNNSPHKIKKELTNDCDEETHTDSIPTKVVFDELLEKFNGPVTKALLCLKDEKDNELRCEAMEKFLQVILEDFNSDPETPSNLAQCLIYALQDEFNRRIFPAGSVLDNESLQESIESPLFVMYRNLCQTPVEDPNLDPILALLAAMQCYQKCIGYLMLYFIGTSKSQDNKMSAYRAYSQFVSKDLNSSLMTDLKNCQEVNVNMFCFLLPDIFSEFNSIAVNNADLTILIVSCIDSTQLQDLICHVLQGDFIMFKKDSLLSLLNTSLEWETFEQYCLWQLISAHNISVDCVLPILPKLEYQNHAEALTSILLLLKRETPSLDLMKHIISRTVKESDYFVVSVLTCWMQEYPEKLCDIISNQLTKSSTPVKRKRQGGNKLQLNNNSEQMLKHLDEVRQKSKQMSFFNRDNMQTALSHVQSICTEAQKNRFNDLFALAEDLLDHKPQMKKGKNAKSKAKSKIVDNCKSSESEISEEEVVPVKQSKTSRKKRKMVTNSDSD